MYARTLEEAWVSCCCWCGWECRRQGGCGDDDVQGAGALWSRCLVAPLSGWRRLPGPEQGCRRSCPRTQNPSGDQRRCGAAQNDSTPHGGGAPPSFAACARRRQRKRSSARKGWGFVHFFGLKPPDTGREDNLSAEGGAWLWGGYVSGGVVGGWVYKEVGGGCWVWVGAVETESFVCCFVLDLIKTTFRGSKHLPASKYPDRTTTTCNNVLTAKHFPNTYCHTRT